MLLIRRFVLSMLVLSLTSTSLYAEANPRISRDSIDSKQLSPTDPADQYRQQINFCRELMNQGNFDGASALLETIYASQPTNSLVINLLMQCYESLQYYAKAEDMIKRQLDLFPSNINFQVTYAELLAKQGKRDEAAKIYESVIASVDRGNIIRVQGILQSMIANDMDAQALTTIDQLRQETGDPSLFAIQRGAILEKQKRYAEAAEEYYPMLSDTTYLGTNAEQRLMDLLNFDESSLETEKVLLKQKDLYSNLNALKLLSNHYLTAGQYDRAYTFTVGLDSIDGFKGSAPLRYMRTCSDLKLYSEAARMCEYVIRNYRTNPLVYEAYFTLADMLRQMGKYPQAISVYDTIYTTSTQKRDQSNALYGIGTIYLDGLDKYDSALVTFDSVSHQFPNTLAQLNSSIGSGYAYLRMGKLDDARDRFSSLLNLRLNDDIKEELTYNLGLIAFFEKQTDTAVVIFKKLMVDFPRGFYVNDALQLLTTIDESGDNTEALYDYSNALLFEQRRMIDSTIAKLSLITSGSDPSLVDVALYKLARIYLSEADSVRAVANVDSLSKRFPESYYLPYGLKMKADILLAGKQHADQAKEIYRLLLEKYPEYPFTSEVRKTMRSLEAPPGSA